MNETQSPAPAITEQTLPPFYHRIVGLNPAYHGDLRLDREAGFGFAATAQSVPLGLAEIEAAAQHFPVLFTTGPNPAPVALLGLREEQNLFVGPDGAWRAGSYVPAYARSFPFIFVEDAPSRTVFVGMEADAACLRRDRGVRLFEDGRPSSALNEAIAFCNAYRESVVAAEVFGRALDAAGLLAEEEAAINFASGDVARIRGFKVLKAERLAELDDGTFLEWRRTGWIAAIYAHLYSAGRWARLIELGAPVSASG